MTKLADPKNDVAFKMIFNPNNLELIKDFLESVIKCADKFPFDPNIAELEFLNKDQLPHLIGGKRSLCDLKVKDAKGKTYIIEMQKRNESDYLKRIQYYASHSVVEQLEQGIGHTKLQPIITISIMGKKCFPMKVPCISYHPFLETTTNSQYLYSQSHIFIELPKLNKANLTGAVLEWLKLFKEAEQLDSIPAVNNKNVLQAYHKLEQFSWSPEDKEAYLAARIEEDIEENNIKEAIAQGKAQGKAEGLEQGKAQGLEQGKAEGLEQGKAQEKVNIAKKMLLKNVDLELIVECSGLSLAEVKRLKQQKK